MRKNKIDPPIFSGKRLLSISLALFLILLLLPRCIVATTATTIDYSTVNSEIAAIDYPAGYVPYYNPASATALAKMMYGEGSANIEEHAATCWVAINRVKAGYGPLGHVLSAPGQFVGYRQKNPVDPLLYALAVDVLIRWDMEECGYTDIGRVLPENYLWFTGSKGHNWFRDAFRGGHYWDWSLPSPYLGGTA